MLCEDCGGTFKACKGSLKLADISLGAFTIDNVEYSRCDKCGELLLPLDTIRKAEEKRTHTLRSMLLSQPIGDFISAADAAQLLGISRQALHQNRRIRRGFIYQTRISGKTVYLRKSVLLFKSTRDGRFLLRGFQEDRLYRTKSESKSRRQTYYKGTAGTFPRQHWTNLQNSPQINQMPINSKQGSYCHA